MILVGISISVLSGGLSVRCEARSRRTSYKQIYSVHVMLRFDFETDERCLSAQRGGLFLFFSLCFLSAFTIS